MDDTLSRLHEVKIPAAATSPFDRPPPVPANAPLFVRQVTARMFEGLGDEIPVSLMPVDGTFPSGTAAFEKRNAIAIDRQVQLFRDVFLVSLEGFGAGQMFFPVKFHAGRFEDSDHHAGDFGPDSIARNQRDRVFARVACGLMRCFSSVLS